MSKIIFIGASNVLGSGLPADAQSFAEQCANKLNSELIISAVNAASNAFLMRQARSHAKDHPDALIVVGWQSWEREEWFVDGVYYQVTAHSPLPNTLTERFKNWVINLDNDNLAVKESHWHKQIWALHKEFKENNIKHLFFNSQYPFFAKPEYNWGINFIGPYTNDLSCHWYLVNQCNISPDEWYHFGVDGHTAWAEFLINYINQKTPL